MQQKIWLSSPHMSGHEQQFLQNAFNENWVAPLGPNVDGFEDDLKKYLSSSGIEVAALSSGTAALHLALVLLGVTSGDEVICQSFTFSASANPILYQGGIPVFVDSEERTWNMSPYFLRKSIENRLSKGKKPKAIILVHLYGMPANMAEIMSVAEEFDIPVIEDAAEALGSNYKGKKCGTFGRLGILSFNGNKIITTSGGGALVSNDSVTIQKARFLATQARDPAPHYQHSTIGYNYRMSNICAGIGRGQMEVLDSRVSQRRSVNKRYKQFFSGVRGVQFQEEINADYFSNYWLTALLIDPVLSGVNREMVRIVLQEANIESRPLWKPMHLQPVFSDAIFFGDGACERMFRDGLCLPSGSNLSEEEMNRIFASLKKCFHVCN